MVLALSAALFHTFVGKERTEVCWFVFAHGLQSPAVCLWQHKLRSLSENQGEHFARSYL